jgi:hypothetical protein
LRDLINEIEQQDRAPEAAGKIQRLNLDIAEALSGIQETLPRTLSPGVWG